MSTRNQEILTAIEQKKYPVLDFEVALARSSFERYVIERNSLTGQMQEAYEQTSETWHDNAAADSINGAAGILAEAANRAINIMKESVVFSDEFEQGDGVTLGSIVTLRFGANEPEDYFFTGVSRKLTPEITKQLDEQGYRDLEIVTISSPIGEAVLGKQAGEKILYKTPRGTVVELTVEAIGWPQLSSSDTDGRGLA